MQCVRLPAIRQSQIRNIIVIRSSSVTNTRLQGTAFRTSRLKHKRVISSRRQRHGSTQVHIPWVTGLTNIRTAHTVHNVQRVTTPASSVNKTTVGNQLNRSRTCIRASVYTRIDTCVSTGIRTYTNTRTREVHVIHVEGLSRTIDVRVKIIHRLHNQLINIMIHRNRTTRHRVIPTEARHRDINCHPLIHRHLCRRDVIETGATTVG